tara:strand:- start:838 stop:1662 length:825 start_codon:yes stop_codon:yes gene_type:complete
MKILIESRTPTSVSIHNALVKGGIQSFLWDNTGASIIDVYDSIRPDIIIINDQCNPMQCKGLAVLESNINFIFIGEWNEHFPKPILCLSNKTYQQFPSIPLPLSTVDIAEVVRGFFDPKVACEIAIFTDGMTEDFVNSNIEIINSLIVRQARFFGRSRLPIPNYLGMVDLDLRSKIIASSDICVDVTGNLWKPLVLSGAVVLSQKSPLEEFLFTDVSSLDKKIEQLLESRPNTSSLKMLALEGSSIDICIDIFRFLKVQQLVEHFIKMRQSLLQ